MWIHWWSSVTSANASMRFWSISFHSPTPSSWPTSPTASSMDEITFIDMLPSRLLLESDLSQCGLDVCHHVLASGPSLGDRKQRVHVHGARLLVVDHPAGRRLVPEQTTVGDRDVAVAHVQLGRRQGRQVAEEGT